MNQEIQTLIEQNKKLTGAVESLQEQVSALRAETKPDPEFGKSQIARWLDIPAPVVDPVKTAKDKKEREQLNKGIALHTSMYDQLANARKKMKKYPRPTLKPDDTQTQHKH